MSDAIEIIPEGTVTTPRGFQAGGIHVAVRTDWTKLDVGLLYSEQPCAAAATYTKNTLPGASLIVSREHLKSGRAQAVVANSGCANAATGKQGMDDAIALAQAAGRRFGIDSHAVVVASTGVIGTYLPMQKILPGVEKMTLSADGGKDFLTSIMTTDTKPKHLAVRPDGRASARCGDWCVGGVVKGAGMIHPNMATMLCFLTTDALVEQPFLHRALKEAVDASFNMIDIDSDTSPDDIVLLMANGRAGGQPISDGHPQAALFAEAVRTVCVSLARQMVADAEGGTKTIQATVEGALSLADARAAAREIVRSLAVKTAVYGKDPNWGRVLSAVGNSGAEAREDKMSLYIGTPDGKDMCLFRGVPVEYDAALAKACFGPDEVRFRVDLGLGEASAVAWGSDLTEDYVRLNSEYTT